MAAFPVTVGSIVLEHWSAMPCRELTSVVVALAGPAFTRASHIGSADETKAKTSPPSPAAIAGSQEPRRVVASHDPRLC